MCCLYPTDDPLHLDALAARIRKSSNFRFWWQFYRFDGIDPRSPVAVREALNVIIDSPELHHSLRASFDDMYDEKFQITPLHDHCRVKSTSNFENILAAAATD